MEEDNNSSVYIPEEIISNVLVRLPANVLHDVMRYVCKLWYNIIVSPDFVKAHLDRSTNSLIILYWEKSYSFKSVTISKDHFVSSSCDGLILIETSKIRDRGKTPFYIANPVTRQCIPYSCCPTDFCVVDGLKLGRSISGVYKLLCYYYSQSASISVLTLGTGKDDDWRSICLGDDSLLTRHAFGPSLTVGGWFYVVMHCYGIICRKHDHSPGIIILAVDLETEIVRRIPGPHSCKRINLSITGGCFSVLEYSADKHEFYVWRLGSASLREWDMVYKCKIEDPYQFTYGPNLMPLGWVVDGEVFGYALSELERCICFTISRQQILL